MRMVKAFSDYNEARRIAEYLYVQKIDNKLVEEDARWCLWIHDDDDIPQAERLIYNFLKNPNNVVFLKSREAKKKFRDEKRDAQKARERYVDVRTSWHKEALITHQPGILTIIFIAISVLVFFLSHFGLDSKWVDFLYFSNFDLRTPSFLARLQYFPPEISEFQLWRFVTPIFLHFGFMHILFNMMWLWDLGSILERKQGTLFLFVFTVVVASLSNFMQFLWSGPSFGGFSGVVYGFLGYFWIRGKYDPHSGFILHSSVVTMMLIWFVVCLVGIIPNVANMAHGVGLAVGMLWGFLAAKLAR